MTCQLINHVLNNYGCLSLNNSNCTDSAVWLSNRFNDIDGQPIAYQEHIMKNGKGRGEGVWIAYGKSEFSHATHITNNKQMAVNHNRTVCMHVKSHKKKSHDKFVGLGSVDPSIGYVLQRSWMASASFMPLIKGQPSRRTPCLLVKRFHTESKWTDHHRCSHQRNGWDWLCAFSPGWHYSILWMN